MSPEQNTEQDLGPLELRETGCLNLQKPSVISMAQVIVSLVDDCNKNSDSIEELHERLVRCQNAYDCAHRDASNFKRLYKEMEGFYKNSEEKLSSISEKLTATEKELSEFKIAKIKIKKKGKK